jgi:hypothetical protein
MSKEPSLHHLNFSSHNRKSKIENLKLVGFVALVLAFSLYGTVASAQQPGKIAKIGYLQAGSAALAADDQSQNRQGSRPDDSTGGPYASGESHQIILDLILDFRLGTWNGDRKSVGEAEKQHR